MTKEVIVTCFLVILFWMTECQVSTTSTVDGIDGDQLYNETITEAILMTEEIDKLIDLLSSVTMSDNPNKHNRHYLVLAGPLLMPIILACITGANLIMSFGFNMNTVVKNSNKADAEQQERIKQDENFKKLMTEIEILDAQLSKLVETVKITANEIVAKLDQLIATIVRLDLNTKVIEPMNLLIENYKTYIKTMTVAAQQDLNITCQKHNPKDIISTMKLKTQIMYDNLLHKNFTDEGLQLIIKLEDYHLMHFSILYPICKSLLNSQPDNETTEYLKIVNATLYSALEPRDMAMEERDKFVWNPDSYSQGHALDLNPILDESKTVEDFAEKTYQFMSQNFYNLIEPLSNTSYDFLVLTAFASAFYINVDATVYYKQVKTNFPNRGTKYIPKIVIYGQQKLEEPSKGCVFEVDEDGYIPVNYAKELCYFFGSDLDRRDGIPTFMKKYCSYRSLVFYARECPELPEGCDIVANSGNQVFKVIHEHCKKIDRFFLLYIYFS